MDRLAGAQTQDYTKAQVRRVMSKPYGAAVDSKGRLYVADTYVGAVFIFNLETGAVEFIRNGIEAHFKTIIGVAIDDNDRLFVSDASLHQINVFGADHKLVNTFGQESLGRPSGIALDSNNRVLYVVDAEKQKVFVFDADNFKLLRTIGNPPRHEGDDEPGYFAFPTNAAVDKEGNLYVTDTINNRVQIFDAEGNFISTFGKNGDAPGFLQRPKGIAIDPDGHIWVADTIQGLVQIFDKEGHLLAFFGGPGILVGQLGLPTGLTFDKQNRVFVTEQLSGRISYFQYVTDEQAAKEKAERNKQAGTPATASAVVAAAQH